MKLSDFEFKLPDKYLAQYPSEERDECKLMLLNRKDQTIEHLVFKDIINFYDEGDVVVLNNTKVFPARLFGNKEKTGARIEVFLLRELNQDQRLWDVLVDPARKIRIGNKLYFGEDESLVAEVIDNTTSISVNQLEFSLTQHAAMHNGTLDQLLQKKVIPMSWSPLGSYFKETNAANKRIKKVLDVLTKKYNATEDQLLLAWILQHPSGVLPVVGTTSKARLENATKALSITLELEDWFTLLVECQGHKVP